MNYSATISHDCTMGDWVTVSPGVNVAGYVRMGDGVFAGLGAQILPGRPDLPLVIGEGCTIAAGATVTRPLGPNLTVAGTPARLIGVQS